MFVESVAYRITYCKRLIKKLTKCMALEMDWLGKFFSVYWLTPYTAVFPNLFRLTALWPTEEQYNLRHQVANPQQCALGFDEILKIYF